MTPAEAQSVDLEAIFRECGRDLTAYFRRRHGDTPATDDLVQESFLQLARRVGKGQAVRSPRAYLFGIARHLSLACFRKVGGGVEPLDAAVEQAKVVEPDARLEAAREVMASLPALQREILDLRFTHGLSYAETAVALAIPLGTVRSRLHEAIALLRRRLERDETPAASKPPSGSPSS